MSEKVAFIGAGGIASVHLENLRSMENAEIVAICDINGKTAQSVAAEYGATSFTEVESLFEAIEMDCVFVCVPPFAHGRPELLAAEHGVALFVEKPLGLSREQAREIREACEESGIVTQVGHMNRYAEITDRAMELVGDRALAVGSGHWIGGVPGTDWWGVKDKSGGQVVEQSTHIYDIVRYFLGDVEEVCAQSSKEVVTERTDFEDASVVSMKHADGPVSQLLTTSAAPVANNGFELVGEDLRLELDFPNDRLTGHVDGEKIEFQGEDGRFDREIEAFISASEADDPELPRSPYDDALKTFELTLDVNDTLALPDPVEVQ